MIIKIIQEENVFNSAKIKVLLRKETRFRRYIAECLINSNLLCWNDGYPLGLVTDDLICPHSYGLYYLETVNLRLSPI